MIFVFCCWKFWKCDDPQDDGLTIRSANDDVDYCFEFGITTGAMRSESPKIVVPTVIFRQDAALIKRFYKRD